MISPAESEDALLFIINKKNGRRNQPDYAQIKLNLKKIELELKQEAKERMEAGVGSNGSGGRGKKKNPFQISEKGLLPQNQQQEPEKKPLSAMLEKSGLGSRGTCADTEDATIPLP